MFLLKEISKNEAMLEVSHCLRTEDQKDYRPLVEKLLAGRQRTISLNLKDLVLINSTTIAEFLLLRVRLYQKGKTLQIQGCSESVYAILQLLKLDDFIPIKK